MRVVPTALMLVFLVALAGFILHGHSGRWKCYRNLMMIDHALNCYGCIQMAKSEGVIDSEGNWKMDDSNFLLQGLNTNRLACPVFEEKYDVTYVVGTHPKCPTHGDLIRFYGFVPHQFTFRSVVWSLGPVVSVLGVVIGGIWTLVSLALVARRRKREDHKQQVQPIAGQSGSV